MVHEYHDLISQVMDLAQEFSPQTNAAMRLRKAALKDMASIAQDWLKDWRPGLVSELDFNAEDGGQIGGVSPIAWMRVYSHVKSPSATAGFYVVYLFESFGMKVFLSLNQGTSEYRAGQWRPIREGSKISEKTAAARLALEQAGVDMTWGTIRAIDLATDALRDTGVFTSRDPVDRARNYELGNIVATTYAVDALPSDKELKQDLFASLDCLATLYEVILESTPWSDGAKKGSPASKGLGRLSAPERLAVEQRSMAVAADHFEHSGWTVKDVSGYRPYDLECVKNGQNLHVEVKGTTNAEFQQIELTRNEVDHCRNYGTTALALVTRIQLVTDTSGHPVGKEGELSVVMPWNIEEARLKPLTYVYQLFPDH